MMSDLTLPHADAAVAISCIESLLKTEAPKEPAPQKDALAAPRTVYFTDGEKLPWKGQWFTLRLREVNGEKLLVLERGKPTAAEEKRQARTERWLRQHPKSQRATVARFNRTVRSLQSAHSSSQLALA